VDGIMRGLVSGIISVVCAVDKITDSQHKALIVMYLVYLVLKHTLMREKRMK
jgi:hypothetical protein